MQLDLKELRAVLRILMLTMLVGVPATGALAGQALDRSVDAVEVQARELAPGTFLVAARSLSDPNFGRSVVLLVGYEETGAFGLIVNRPLTVKLADAVPALAAVLEARNDRLHFGGPVEGRGLWILLQNDRAPPAARAVFGQVYLSGDVEAVRRLLTVDPQAAVLRAYAGYAGWGPRQLDAEVARGDWLVVPADEAQIFSKDPSRVWPELIAHHDGTWAQLFPRLARR